MKKVKYITAGLALCGILTGLMSCGVVNTDGDSASSVSGSAVTGSVATGSAASGSTLAVTSTEKDVERNRYANHNNIYKTTYDISDEYEENQKLAQMKLDGTVVQRYEIEGLDGVAWVTDEWVYYVIEKCALWRAPIEKAAGGDRLKLDRAERLFQEEYLYAENIYVADTGVFYIAAKYELRQYDFAKKKSVLLKKVEGWLDILFTDEPSENRPIMLGDSLFIQHQHESKLYTLDTTNASLKEIYKDLDLNLLYPDSILEYEDSVYFVPNSEEMQVYRYDGEKVECMIKKGAMKKRISDLNYPTGDEVAINRIFTYKDRMYFYVRVQSQSKHEEYWWGYKANLLLSAPVGDLLHLEGDDKFFHYMNGGDNRYVSYDHETKLEQEQPLQVGDVWFYDRPLADVAGGWDGKLILEACSFVPTSGVGYYDYDYAIYDLDTGEIEETEAAKAVQNKDAKALKKAIISSQNIVRGWFLVK